MYNMRYHVASLAAVFLALTVGLILGTAIADRAGLDKRQQQLLASVQAEFDNLRASNQALSRQIQSGNVLENEAASRFVKGRLTGERILLVVEGSGLPEGARDLLARLVEAGAQVQVLAIRQPGWGLEDARVAARVAAASGESAEDTPALARAIESTMPAELARAGGGPMSKALVESGVLTLEPADAAPAGGVVLYHGSGSAADRDISEQQGLGRRFVELKVDVVGVERTDADPSMIAAFRDARIPSVDDVDRPIGQLSTVLVLAGKGLTGHYGSKPTATAPMPPLSPGS